MDIRHELLTLMDESLHLDGRAKSFQDDRPLLGSLPEMDSMGVVAVITAMEERFGFTIEDDEIDGQVFYSVGTLIHFITAKLGSPS